MHNNATRFSFCAFFPLQHHYSSVCFLFLQSYNIIFHGLDLFKFCLQVLGWREESCQQGSSSCCYCCWWCRLLHSLCCRLRSYASAACLVPAVLAPLKRHRPKPKLYNKQITVSHVYMAYILNRSIKSEAFIRITTVRITRLLNKVVHLPKNSLQTTNMCRTVW